MLLFPINPKQLVRYRESYPGGGEDDPTNARYLARMLRWSSLGKARNHKAFTRKPAFPIIGKMA